jgi:hypothetical protein
VQLRIAAAASVKSAYKRWRSAGRCLAAPVDASSLNPYGRSRRGAQSAALKPRDGGACHRPQPPVNMISQRESHGGTGLDASATRNTVEAAAAAGVMILYLRRGMR